MIDAIHFVLDLETMSTGPNAAIAAIGCVRVQQGEIVDEFYERVDLESSRAMGGEIDTPTLQWWLTQPQEARQEVSGELPAIHIATALGKLSEFMRRGGITDDQPMVWGNGSSFDNVILGSAYQRTGLTLPWKFWNDRDLRTLLALYPQAKKSVAFEGIKHHALNDARHEARQLIAALELHAARTVAISTLIQAVSVERDEYGHWTHAAWPATDDEVIPNGWFADQGLELAVMDFEGDAPQDLVDAYFGSGEPDCSKWEPSKPDGEDWFIFSIHDTEDGPVCVWVRPTVEAARAQEKVA